MTALSPDCLVGLTVGIPVATQGTANGERLGDEPRPMDCGEPATAPAAGDFERLGVPDRGIGTLVDGLVGLGATAADQGAVDLLLVPVDADGSLDAAADGELATALAGAFAAARDNAARIHPGGCVLFVLESDDPARAAVGSLTKTLALEWAPSLRVNTIVCADPGGATSLIALVASPASRALTGAVLEVA
jgi:hypothetical protein